LVPRYIPSFAPYITPPSSVNKIRNPPDHHDSEYTRRLTVERVGSSTCDRPEATMRNQRRGMADHPLQEEAPAPRCPRPTDEIARQERRLVVQVVHDELVDLRGQLVRYGFGERRQSGRRPHRLAQVIPFVHITRLVVGFGGG
jgi:hypothetical protein